MFSARDEPPVGAVCKVERKQRNETRRAAHPQCIPGCPPAGMCGTAGRTTGPAGEHRAASARKAQNHPCMRAGPGGACGFLGKANSSWIHGGTRHCRGRLCQGIPHPQHLLSECHSPTLWVFLQQAWLPDKLAGHFHCYERTHTSSHGRRVSRL